MSDTLTISKREITRLRTRFTGKSRFMVLGILILAMVLSYVIYHQEIAFSKGLYNIAVSPDGPTITDQRFNVITASCDSGYAMLGEGTIDAFVQEDNVWYSENEKSQRAIGALQEYLQKQEINRIAAEYDIAQAFPLRIRVHHLERDSQRDLEDTQWAAGSEISVAARPDSPRNSEWDGQTTMAFPGSTLPDETADNSAVSSSNNTIDDEIRKQLNSFNNGNNLPEFNAEFASENQVIIPSLHNPPIPLAQVLLAFLYIVPIFFVSVFFTSSFMEEKSNRKLVILMSAPITPTQIILGKMLPYIGYSIITIIAITLVLSGNVLLALAIFIPVMLFILSVYLMVALLYRTFKDQTFFSVLAVWIVTAYLVAPAMFAGANDLSYISPLTLAVEMYRGEPFGLSQYLLSTIPMYLIFGAVMFVSTRIFNEEFLMGFKPLHTKLSEAAFMAIDQQHVRVSIFLLSFCMIPVVFMAQFAAILIASNLSGVLAAGVIFVLAVITEEIAKSTGVFVLLQNKIITTTRSVIALSFVAALGFLIGEKLLLYLALSIISESMFTDAVFSSGMLIMPLVLHFGTTSTVCLITARLGNRYYPLGIFAGAVIHGVYNLWVISGAA